MARTFKTATERDAFYKENYKKMIVHVSKRSHPELLIRLTNIRMSNTMFFNILIESFTNDDPRIVDVITEHINNKSQKTAHRIKKLISDGAELKKVYGLDEDEVDSIYDLLEDELS